MSKHAKTYIRLVAAGYRRDKAILAVYSAFGLTPEQLAKLQVEVK